MLGSTHSSFPVAGSSLPSPSGMREMLVAALQQVGGMLIVSKTRNCVPLLPLLVPWKDGLLLPRKAGNLCVGQLRVK